MGRFDLVIFDCDGVLVDSERVAVALERELLADLGWSLSEAEIVERFVGRSDEHIRQEVEDHLGRSVDWIGELEHHFRDRFEEQLVVVAGIPEALAAISTPVAVASNSLGESLRFKLGLVDLLDRFEGALFCLDDVVHAKPAPDLYLHAARVLDVAPSRCAVVEDSVAGVAAGVAAGMTVFAFAGGLTNATLLALDGVVIFEDMRELPGLLG